jgi:putative selenate reductase molybdopterin-binding subunit
MDGVAPAVGNAVLDACGAQVDENPVTPERLWRALYNAQEDIRT